MEPLLGQLWVKEVVVDCWYMTLAVRYPTDWYGVSFPFISTSPLYCECFG